MAGVYRLEKKQKERFQLESFLKALALPAKILEDKRESPDFIVCLEGRKVGIELTDLFIHNKKNAHLPQAQESIADKIVSHAQHLYEESSAPPAHVSIGFFHLTNLNKNESNKIAERLSSFVRNLDLDAWQTVDISTDKFEKSPLPEEVAFIHALGVPSYDMALWVAPRAGWVATLTPQVLQNRINEKSKKLKEYQKVVSENWLVVIISNSKPSQMFSVSSEFNPSEVISPFSRTFYYAYMDKKIIELGI